MPKDISRLINKIKSGVKVAKVADKIKTAQPKTPFNPVVKTGIKERNMMKEAIEMGSHGAKDMWGNPV